MNRLVTALLVAAALSPATASAGATASPSCVGPASAEPPIVCSGCDVTDARVRTRSGSAQVFTAPDGRGRSLFGCLIADGEPLRLGRGGFYEDEWGEHQDSWDLVRTRGRFAAFERHYFGCPSFHCRKSELQVYDLRSGRRTFRRVDEPSEPYFVGASDLVLAKDGSLAWIGNRDGRVWAVPGSGDRPAKLLGRHAEPRSLTLEGRTVRWVRNGEKRHGQLD